VERIDRGIRRNGSKFGRGGLIGIGLLALSAGPLFAQSVGVWNSGGPSAITNTGTMFQWSGKVNRIVVDPANANTIYAGASGGGVWKTTNGGTSWTPLTDSQCTTATGALAVDPVNSQIVYAGTGELNFSASDATRACGVLRSPDGGATWTQLGLSTFNRVQFTQLLIDPATAGSTTGTKLLAGTGSGLFGSSDSGNTWSTNALPNPGPVSDVVADPTNTNNILAAIGCPSSTGFSCSGNFASNGIYRSTNGVSGPFTKLVAASGLPTTNVGRIALAISPSTPTTVYAAIQNSAAGANFGNLLGMFKSTDGGQNWAPVAANNAICNTACQNNLFLRVHPTDPNTVYFGARSLFKSTDGAANFTDITGAGSSAIHNNQNALAFQPGTPTTIYVANGGGVFVSANAGGAFLDLNSNLAIAEFNSGISMHPTNTQIALGGANEVGTLYFSGSSAWSRQLGNNGCFTAIDYNTPTTAYAERNWSPPSPNVGGPNRTDNLGTAAFVSKTNGISLTDRAFSPCPPRVMSPTDPLTLYFGTFRVYKTPDKGETWTAISPDLTNSVCTTSTTTTSCAVTTIAQAKSDAQVIYAGTGDGNMWVTTNGGTNWTKVNTGLPAGQRITQVAVDPMNSQNAYVGYFGSGLGIGHVFKTTNGGGSWTDISGNLGDQSVFTIVLSPWSPGTAIYIGTINGVSATTDGGTTWNRFGSGLPNTQVNSLIINQAHKLLVAGTYGRGAWATSLGSTTATHDFNADSKSDLLWYNTTSGQAVIWLVSGTSVIGGGSPGSVGSPWAIVGQRDFNGDGFFDILWRNGTSGQLVVWLINGTAVTGGGSLGGAANPWTVAGTGDFDGDGFGDVFWYNTTTGQVVLWFTNGSSVTGGGSPGSVGSPWAVAGTGDFNGDGKTDILWYNTSTGQAVIWLLNGANVIGGGSPGSAGSPWAIAGTGDFNGDGMSDILWLNGTTGQAVEWLITGTSVTGGGSLGSAPSPWTIAETGDFNADGMSDVLWYNSTSGQLVIWLVAGPSVIGGGSPGSAAPPWQIQGMNAD
jgi:hypothetical protein